MLETINKHLNHHTVDINHAGLQIELLSLNCAKFIGVFWSLLAGAWSAQNKEDYSNS